MKKKEKTVLCLIFLAAILYSGITYIANGAAILDYYFDRHIWPWIIPFILCISCLELSESSISYVSEKMQAQRRLPASCQESTIFWSYATTCSLHLS